jgi:4-hydroxymandelate oxidase
MHTTRRAALQSALGLAAAAFAAARKELAAQTVPHSGPITASPVPLASLADYEGLARRRMSHQAYEYVAGGAADELTLRANRDAYDRLRLDPRVLVDVSRLDTRVTLLGRELAFPILIAPTAYHRMVHREGEQATARGATAAKAAMVVSSFSTATVEDIAKAGKGPFWFQLYVQPDRGFTRELVQRVEAAGYEALCLTVDTPTTGARDRQIRAGFALPPGVAEENLRRGGKRVEGVLDPSMTWREVEWLRSFARVPVVLKGILHPADATRAAEVGAAGILVSNHGARNLDTLPATIEALPRVVDAVQGRLPVLVDGGVRRGTDVLKALALGARAVLIGRPSLYGLAVAGADGVAGVVNLLRAELEMAMALTGRPTLANIDRSVLWPAPPEYR